MPIYDYLCSSCGHRTEVIHGINEAGPRFCPSCGAEGTLRKGFSTPAILFKGSGWAKKDRAATRSPRTSKSTDASEGGSSASTADSSKATPSSDSSSTSTSKPATSGQGGD